MRPIRPFVRPGAHVAHAAHLSIAIAALSYGTMASAQDAPPAAPGAETGRDIVVTARRRDENAQDVPIALSVIGADRLAASGSYTLTQVQQLAPSLQIIAFNPRNTNINIRGLGSNVAFTNDGLENGVGVYIDNVYYGRVGASQFDLVDLQQVEVLRGPQGTLFGKNTTAGAINISSRLPSFEPEISGEASIGNYGHHQVRASASGPLADNLAVRLSLADTHRDGYIRNVLTGGRAQSYDDFTVRGQLLYKPTDTLDIRVIGDYSHQKSVCCVSLTSDVFTRYDSGTPITNNYYDRVARLGYTPLPNDAFARRTDYDGRYQVAMKGYGVSGQVDWRLGGVTLTSITAHRWWDWDPQNDSDNSALDIFRTVSTRNRQRQFSQELRLASEGHRTIDWVGGLYYFWQEVRGYNTMAYGSDAAAFNLPAVPAALGAISLDGFESQAFSNPVTRSYAAFGQATWNLSDALKVTAGLRYTHEAKEGAYEQIHTGGANLSVLPPALAGAALSIRDQFARRTAYATRFSDDNLSGLLTLSYAPSRDVLTYATYSHGSKSGGLNLSVLPAGVSPQVKPESVGNFELGVKSQWFDRTLTANLALFQADVRNYQTVVFDAPPGMVTSFQYIGTVPKVRSRGIEADLTWQPRPWLGLNASGTYLDATYRSYTNAVQKPEDADQGASQDLSGQRLAGSSKFSYTLGADISQPVGLLTIYAHADYSHRSSFYTTVSNSRYSLIPAYGLVNARIGLRTEGGGWDLSVWARNLGETDYYQSLSPGNNGAVTAVIGEPRTYGATLRAKI
jgi:iron complex outermembrane receptor protein